MTPGELKEWLVIVGWPGIFAIALLRGWVFLPREVDLRDRQIAALTERVEFLQNSVYRLLGAFDRGIEVALKK